VRDGDGGDGVELGFPDSLEVVRALPLTGGIAVEAPRDARRGLGDPKVYQAVLERHL
jgi:hypothetical protein